MDQFKTHYSKFSAWDHRFLDLAEHVSQWSKDPSTKVGAVITHGRSLIGIGYNGFATGVKDLEERLHDRSVKYPLTLHAEENAVIAALQHAPFVSDRTATIYVWPFMPCAHCMAVIINSKKIGRVVAPYVDNENWEESWMWACEQVREHNDHDDRPSIKLELGVHG